jgi:tetratricopeptide (TPR) repeat protein
MSASRIAPILDAAQRAASSGNYTLAETLLREVARLQAEILGPQHRDLASTYNNLGVVCERANNLQDAGKFYRQAFSIASASLDADDPLVITSRNNVNEFYRALGLVDTAASSPVDAAPPVEELEDALRRTDERAHDANVFTTFPASTSVRLAMVPGIAVAVALLSALGIWWTRVPREPGTVNERVSALGNPLVPMSRLQESTPSPHSVTGTIARRPAVEKASRLPASSVKPAVSMRRVAASTSAQVMEVSLCESLSTDGGRWDCTPSSAPSAGGVLYFYTRIASPTNTRIHHRWYQNGVLRHDVTLAVQANPSAGYRTYSRRRVDSGDWRVAAVDADGALLREEHIAVP